MASTTNIRDLFASININARSTEEAATVSDAEEDIRFHLKTGTATLEGTVKVTFESSQYSNNELIAYFYEVNGAQGQPVKWILTHVCCVNGRLEQVQPSFDVTGSGYSIELARQVERNWIPENVYDRFQESLGYSNFEGSSYKFNFKVFGSYDGALSYAQTGDTSDQVFGYTPPTNFNDLYYIHETRYQIASDGSKVKESEIYTEYQVLGDNSLILVGGEYSAQEGDHLLRYSGSRINIHNKLTDEWTYAATSLAKYYYYTSGTYDFGDTTILVSLQTNIPIVKDNDDYNDYLATGDNSLIQNLEDVLTNPTGEEINDTELLITNCKTPFVKIYILDTDLIEKIHDWLFREETKELLKASLWGDSPIDMVIDVLWTPLNLEQFTIDIGSRIVKFGDISCTTEESGWTQSLYSPSTIDSYGVGVTLFDDVILGTYNDWRDYECSYKLYLPFYGEVSLDPNIIIGHTLRIVTNYFYTSKVLKHYLYIDGIIWREVEVNHGCSIALTAVDQQGKGREMINALTNISTGAISSGAGIASGNASAVASGVGNIANGMMSMATKPSHEKWGNNSASANSNDVPYCYLTIECPAYIVPNKLHELYNYPTYIMTKLSTCAGYTEATDVRLSTAATPTEKNEIVSMIYNGIII